MGEIHRTCIKPVRRQRGQGGYTMSTKSQNNPPAFDWQLDPETQRYFIWKGEGASRTKEFAYRFRENEREAGQMLRRAGELFTFENK